MWAKVEGLTFELKSPALSSSFQHSLEENIYPLFALRTSQGGVKSCRHENLAKETIMILMTWMEMLVVLMVLMIIFMEAMIVSMV